MSDPGLTDVFTVDELARAAGVPLGAARALIRDGDLRPVPGTSLFRAADIIQAAPRLRALSVGASPARDPRTVLVGTPNRDDDAEPAVRRSIVASSCVHGLLLLLILALSTGRTHSAPAVPLDDPARLVFLVTPGPGGGGGGSGKRDHVPAPRLEHKGTSRTGLSTPRVTPDPVLASATRDEPPAPAVPATTPVEQPPDLLSSSAVIAPVVMVAVSQADRAGVVAPRPDAPASRGPGTGSDAGGGSGNGNGDGLGSGTGAGSGGGTGGGPYRPGSGIQPPRLLREVKAEYPEEARRLGLTGNVVMEIVIRRDGGVGTVTVTRGLGHALDQRAVAAVRQWRFAPATRLGEAVDVIVEVSVEFTLR